jgi:hypothetical protein
LLIVDAATGTSRRIRTSTPLAYVGPQAPAWTAGGRLLWVRHLPVEGGSADVMIADRRGRRQHLIPVQGPFFGGVARAAPSGGSIAVAVWSPSPQLVVLPAGGGPRQVFADCANPLGQPERLIPCATLGRLDWSPDGTRIAAENWSSARVSTIQIVEVATGFAHDVRPGTAPFWSPDGRLLGSISPENAIEIGPPEPGAVQTLPLRGVQSADWQARP